LGTLALSNKMKCPSQTRAHRAAKLAGTLALAGTRAGKPFSARKLFPGRPLPDPKGLDNNGYICEYNQPSRIAVALAKRI